MLFQCRQTKAKLNDAFEIQHIIRSQEPYYKRLEEVLKPLWYGSQWGPVGPHPFRMQMMWLFLPVASARHESVAHLEVVALGIQTAGSMSNDR